MATPTPTSPSDRACAGSRCSAWEALRAELDRTRAERDEACAARDRLAEKLRATTEQLVQTAEDLRATKEQLVQTATKLHDVLELAHRRAKAKKAKAPASPPAPPPQATEEQARAFEGRPTPPVVPPKTPPPPTQQRRPGRAPIPPHIPRSTTTVGPGDCPVCGLGHHPIVDTVEEVKLDALLNVFQARVTLRKVGLCETCERRVIAPAPPAPFARSKLTCEALALIIYMNIVMLLPLDRIHEWFEKAMGVPMSVGFLVKMKERAAKLLDAVDGEHWKQLQASPWMGVDGTGHKVIVEGLPGTQHAYLEVYRNDAAVVFQFGLNKLGTTLVSRLALYAGIVVCDGESRNGTLFEAGRATEAGCNAHLFRGLKLAVPEQPLASEAIAFVSQIYALHERSGEQNLTGDALREFRQREIKPVYERLRLWADAVEPALLPSDGLGGMLRYLQNQWTPLTRWLDHPFLPPDNNGCEREFQRVAKGRYAWLFFGSPEGGHRTATLLGIVATCRLLGVDPLKYLVWAFQRLGTARATFGSPPAKSLTPAAYKASLAEVTSAAA